MKSICHLLAALLCGHTLAAEPAPAIPRQTRKVPLYFSLAYQPGRSGAEFHPSADWLRENGRDPGMARGVEFSGVHDFDLEMFALLVKLWGVAPTR